MADCGSRIGDRTPQELFPPPALSLAPPPCSYEHLHVLPLHPALGIPALGFTDGGIPGQGFFSLWVGQEAPWWTRSNQKQAPRPLGRLHWIPRDPAKD